MVKVLAIGARRPHMRGKGKPLLTSRTPVSLGRKARIVVGHDSQSGLSAQGGFRRLRIVRIFEADGYRNAEGEPMVASSAIPKVAPERRTGQRTW